MVRTRNPEPGTWKLAPAAQRQSSQLPIPQRSRQGGYALIGTLGALTVMLILISGMLSTVAQQVKREREAELLFRGRQIVEAIVRYQTFAQIPASQRRQGSAAAFFGVWPASVEQLAEGITLPGTTRQIRLLRRWALQDPMTREGKWEPVGYGDPALKDFLEAYFDYVGRTIPPQVQIKYLGGDIDFGDGDKQSSQNRQPRFRFPTARPGAAEGVDEEQESFIFGVVSRSQEKPLRDYYGLERYDQWVFVPIPELQQFIATGDAQIRMAAREITFPSDPLIWRLSPLSRRGFTVAQPRPTRTAPRRITVPNPAPPNRR